MPGERLSGDCVCAMKSGGQGKCFLCCRSCASLRKRVPSDTTPLIPRYGGALLHANGMARPPQGAGAEGPAGRGPAWNTESS